MERIEGESFKKRTLVVKVLSIAIEEDFLEEAVEEEALMRLGIAISDKISESEPWKFRASHIHEFEPQFSIRVPQISRDLSLELKLQIRSNDSDTTVASSIHKFDLSQFSEKEVVVLDYNSKEIAKATLQLSTVELPLERRLSREYSSQEDMTPEKLKSFARSMKMLSLKSDKSNKKNKSFRKIFSLPETETVYWDCSAALRKQILHHGRMYISKNYLCFYSNIFSMNKWKQFHFQK